MSNFIKYENLDFQIANKTFYATSVQISLKTNLQPVLLSDGSLLRYAPQNAVIGSLSTQFYLTGALPTYLMPTIDSESSIPCSFGGVVIPSCYIKSLSFDAGQYNPISLSLEMDWFGDISATDNTTYSLQGFNSTRNAPLEKIAHSYQTYVDDLLDTFGFTEIFNFKYSEQADRIPFFKIGETSPFRVAKTNRSKNLEIQGNLIKGNLVNYEGLEGSATVYLKNYEGETLNTFTSIGKIQSQSFNVDNNGIVQSTIAIPQRIAPLRSAL